MYIFMTKNVFIFKCIHIYIYIYIYMSNKLIIFILLEQINTTFYFFVYYYEAKQPLIFEKTQVIDR